LQSTTQSLPFQLKIRSSSHFGELTVNIRSQLHAAINLPRSDSEEHHSDPVFKIIAFARFTRFVRLNLKPLPEIKSIVVQASIFPKLSRNFSQGYVFTLLIKAESFPGRLQYGGAELAFQQLNRVKRIGDGRIEGNWRFRRGLAVTESEPE
jgi:hypothetical protein